MVRKEVIEEEEQGMPSFQDIEKEMSSKEQENQYLRSRNFGLQDATEGGFMPKPEPNVIEFKLSSDDLLERIEHYLKGDVLKSRTNSEGETETYYSPPTKKISVSLFRDNITGRVYVVNEHPTGKEEEDWDLLSVFEVDEEGRSIENNVEDNYKNLLLNELLTALESKAKKPKITHLGLATKEVIDPLRVNLNEYGVQEVMNILSMYITKETFLSFYKEERIFEILGDLGNQLNKFFLINSKAIGLNTEYKKTKYPLIIVTIIHAVENAYRRALQGNENRGTREGIIVTQHQGVGSNPYPQSFSKGKKSWSLFDKSTW